jgi:hypothetical protein
MACRELNCFLGIIAGAAFASRNAPADERIATLCKGVQNTCITRRCHEFSKATVTPAMIVFAYRTVLRFPTPYALEIRANRIQQT